MSLINCSECGNQVSSLAANCPKCGNPIAARADTIAAGQPRGPCPGYVVDHITPLCAGGPDSPNNMQWQTIEAGKLKDKGERAQCRR